jgi:hypothetical protein
VSIGRSPDLRAQYRVAVTVAAALIAAVATYWALVPTLARLGALRPAFAGNVQIGHLALGLGVVAVVAAGVMRRATLASGGGPPAARLLSASIVALALAEVPAVFGLVAYVLTGLAAAAYPLFVLSLAALLLYFPRWPQWVESANALNRPA